MGTATEELLTRREAARLARVSYNGIRNWERTGRVTPVRVMHGGVDTVMIPREQIEEIIRERREQLPMTDDLSTEVQLLREERDRLLRDLEVERARYDALLAKLLEITGPAPKEGS